MSDQKKDGGPAFPGFPNTQQGRFPRDGMTLRDWFAGQAAAGLCANVNLSNIDPARVAGVVSICAFDVADAMLADREQQK